jgi:hypothetical protein
MFSSSSLHREGVAACGGGTPMAVMAFRLRWLTAGSGGCLAQSCTVRAASVACHDKEMKTSSHRAMAHIGVHAASDVVLRCLSASRCPKHRSGAAAAHARRRSGVRARWDSPRVSVQAAGAAAAGGQ